MEAGRDAPFIGRERELGELEDLYAQEKFQLFVLYGRRRVGKTTLLNEFCRGKDAIFYSAELSSDRWNLEHFSSAVYEHYGEAGLSPFSSWADALCHIRDRQAGRRLVLVIDEFPYLARRGGAILSELQNLIDHSLLGSRLFIILCGSYMGFMEKEVLGSKSPLFGRRTGQLHMKSLDYRESIRFLDGFGDEDKLRLYGAFGGTPMYLQQVRRGKSFRDNVMDAFLKVTAYLYEEPLLLLRQEVQEPGIYNAIIEAVAGGASRANEILTKVGEDAARGQRHIKTLCELGILYKEAPFGEKESPRKTIYGICDFMFRFWYRYVFENRTLVETGAREAVWERRIAPDYSSYMGHVFEKICRDYLLIQNGRGNLPFLFTSIGRWWGANPDSPAHEQVEIDIVASDGGSYLFGECKWRNEPLGMPVLGALRKKADVFRRGRGESWYVLFSKSGFADDVRLEAGRDGHVLLVGLSDITGC